MMLKSFEHWISYPSRILVASFGLCILIGGCLLSLPLSALNEPVGFLNALFTATSAVCVTGLAVDDTATTYSGFGKCVILVLIQIGGLGITTMSTAILVLLGRRVSVGSRDAVEDTFVLHPRRRFEVLLFQIFLWTISIEAFGVMWLFLAFNRLYPADEALWQSIFHAISAFCNAGFSLNSASLTPYRYDPNVLIPVSILIILGGLGFYVHVEIIDWLSRRLKNQTIRISIHTRLALSATATLLIVGTAGYALCESNNILKGTGWGQAMLTSFFASVTVRTAGFNIFDYSQISVAALFLTLLLMLVGGCPGSTAGGIKVTTVGVLFAMAYSRFRGLPEVRLFNRALPKQTLVKALAIFSGAFALISISVMVLSRFETAGLPTSESSILPISFLFETMSALGTVGLSMGLTPELSDRGKLLIMLLMFIGRVGPLTMVIALSRRSSADNLKYAEEQVMVG